MAAPQANPQPSQSTSLSFTQGFLLGQLSIALLIFAFIKFFIFGDPPPPDVRASLLANTRRQRTLHHHSSARSLRHKRSTILRPQPSLASLATASILEKTYYNVAGHQPESLDWFNVLVAQTLAQLRADAREGDAVLKSLNDVLNGSSKPDFLDEIKVTEVDLGDEFPIFSNCRIIPVEEGLGLGSAGVGSIGGREGVRVGEGTRLQARMDVDLSDVLTLGVETKLVLNYPRPRVAVLPVALAVSVVRFSGTLTLSFLPTQPLSSTSTSTHHSSPSSDSSHPTSTSRHRTALAFTFLDDYRLDLSVRSLVGSRSRLQDVPKIAQLVEDRLHAWFDERCVEPRFQQIGVPNVWPRKRNTRGGEEEQDQDGEDAGDEALGASIETLRPDAETACNAGGLQGLSRPAMNVRHEPESLEERMADEGRKLREAENRGRTSRHAGNGPQAEGMRWRAGHGERTRNASADSLHMPGSMPGELVH